MDYQKMKFVPIILWSLLILILSIIPLQGYSQEGGIITIDKLGHLFLYFALTFMLINADFNSYTSGTISISYGIVIETIQMFLTYRFFSGWDILFNSLGAALAILFMSYTRRRLLS